jgi:hypothetical protein
MGISLETPKNWAELSLGSMPRVLALFVAPLLLSSCVWPWPLVGEPGIAISEYVVTGSASDVRHACDIVRDVAAANGLRLYDRDTRPHEREYRNRDARGLANISMSVFTRQPVFITISENTEKPTALHRQIFHDLESRLTRAGIPFHKPSADERLRLKEEQWKKQT